MCRELLLDGSRLPRLQRPFRGSKLNKYITTTVDITRTTVITDIMHIETTGTVIGITIKKPSLAAPWQISLVSGATACWSEGLDCDGFAEGWPSARWVRYCCPRLPPPVLTYLLDARTRASKVSWTVCARPAGKAELLWNR